MVRAALLTLLVISGLPGLACSTNGGGGKPADPSPCDFKVKAMSDPSQKQIECGGGGNGETFIVRQGTDGKWYEEMKVRAGTRPGYGTPEEAARARCCAADR